MWVHTHQICRERHVVFGQHAFYQHVDAYYRLFLPPLLEPADGLWPAARTPRPGPREPVNPTDTHTAIVGGNAARSPPTCQEASETLLPDTEVVVSRAAQYHNIRLFTKPGLLPLAMMACMKEGLVVKLFFHWSPLALWLQTNTHHSNADTSQPHCSTIKIHRSLSHNETSDTIDRHPGVSSDSQVNLHRWHWAV